MELLNIIDVTNISFGVLFVWLLVDTKKDSKQREEKYQETIFLLSDKFNILEDVKNDVSEIKQELRNN